MPAQAIQPGATFCSTYVEQDLFVFNHACSLIEGDGLFRRFNRAGAFIEPAWYRFNMKADHLKRVGEWDVLFE